MRAGEGAGERQLVPRAMGYVLAGGLALVAAVAAKEAALAALAIPFLLAMAVALALDGAACEAELSCELSASAETVPVGERVEVTARLSASRRVGRAWAYLEAPKTEAAPDEPGERLPFELKEPPRWLISLKAKRPRQLTIELQTTRPGEVSLGPLVVVVSGPAGLYRRRVRLGGTVRVRARPQEEPLRTLPRSSRVRVAAGDRLARLMGEGIELAEVRAERPGERSLRINWRATARRGAPHVTTRHPEHSTDVVLFMDTFQPRSLPRVVEVAAAAAAGYLARRDRVGLVSFGGVLDWVEAGSGARQLERIRARLAATRPFFSYAWKTIERIPPRAMPSGALVLAVSPLRDERTTSALAELRARGHQVMVIAISPPERPEAPDEPAARRAARLLDRMEQEDLRERLWLRGIPVAPLGPGEPLEPVFAGLEEVRRKMRPGARR